jgi:hypothetical protein
MAISKTELELQDAEFLPAREVMSSCGRKRSHNGGDTTVVYDNDGNTYQNGLLNISALNGNFSGASVWS